MKDITQITDTPRSDCGFTLWSCDAEIGHTLGVDVFRA